MGSTPAGASVDRGVVTNTRAACVAQGHGIPTLLLQLTGGKMDQRVEGRPTAASHTSGDCSSPLGSSQPRRSLQG